MYLLVPEVDLLQVGAEEGDRVDVVHAGDVVLAHRLGGVQHQRQAPDLGAHALKDKNCYNFEN